MIKIITNYTKDFNMNFNFITYFLVFTRKITSYK